MSMFLSVFTRRGGKPSPAKNASEAAAPRATETRRASKGKSAAPSKLLKCEVAPPKQTTAAVPHKLLYFLGQCTSEDFDGIKAMIALAKWAEERDRRIPISSTDLDTSEIQQIHINLSAHRELIEAIDELLLSEEAGDAGEFLEFLEEMRNILGRTSSEMREICIEKKIDLNAPHQIDLDKKKTLSAALRLVCRRLKTDNEGSFAARLESALSNTPAQLAKHDLISLMNDFRREAKGTVNTKLLEDCLTQSLREVGYKDDDELLAHDTVKQLMGTDGSERRQLLDGLLAAMHNVWDGADPPEARERLYLAVQSVWDRSLATAALSPLMRQLARFRVDSLAVMRELLRLSLSPETLNERMLLQMTDFHLSQAYKNILPYRNIQEVMDDFVIIVDRLHPKDKNGQSTRADREADGEREFMTQLSAMNRHLFQTWELLKSRCKDKGIKVHIKSRPFDPLEKKLIVRTLKAAFNRIKEDPDLPVSELIDRAIRRAKVLTELDSVRDYFRSTGTIKSEFEDLLYVALERVGIADSSERRKLAGHARTSLMNLTAEYAREVLEVLSRTLSDTNFGPGSKDMLVKIIRDIDRIAQMPGAEKPEGTLQSMLTTVGSIEEAEDRIHNLGLKVLEAYPDEELVIGVKLYLKEQRVAPEMAQQFLRYANLAKLGRRSELVRLGLRAFVVEAELREKI